MDPTIIPAITGHLCDRSTVLFSDKDIRARDSQHTCNTFFPYIYPSSRTFRVLTRPPRQRRRRRARREPLRDRRETWQQACQSRRAKSATASQSVIEYDTPVVYDLLSFFFPPLTKRDLIAGSESVQIPSEKATALTERVAESGAFSDRQMRGAAREKLEQFGE